MSHTHTYSHNIFEADISSTVNKVLHCVFMTSFSRPKQKGSLMKLKKQLDNLLVARVAKMIHKLICLASELQILSEYTRYTNSSMLSLILRNVKSSVLQAHFYKLLLSLLIYLNYVPGWFKMGTQYATSIQIM